MSPEMSGTGCWPGVGTLRGMQAAPALSDGTWTLIGYVTLGLGVLAAVVSALLAVGSRVRQNGRTHDAVVADVRATISQLAEPNPAPVVSPQLSQWEQHAAEVASRQLDLYLRQSASALRQDRSSFVVGMSAAVIGFLAILGS